MQKDYHYICNNMNSLSAIPVRLYKDNELEKNFSVINLDKDPASLYLDQLLNTTNNVEYTYIEDSQVYGIIKSNEYTIVMGPIGSFVEDTAEIERIAFLLGFEKKEERASFISDISLIPNMPLYSFLQMLCTVNFYLNDEKLNFRDISINENLQLDITSSFEEIEKQEIIKETSTIGKKHNFLSFEKTMLHLVETGNYIELEKFLGDVSPGTTGTVGANPIRHTKNLFVTSATIVSRAAINGGLDQVEAFTMSDYYIQRAELLQSTYSILNLQYHMLLEYAKKVHDIRKDKELTRPVIDAINYIKKNILHVESIDEIADAVYLSRSYLGFLFKKETGKSIAEYMTAEKIEEAKRLLKFTDKPLISISNYLGFSSQSHFQNTFKKLEKITPREYRTKQN